MSGVTMAEVPADGEVRIGTVRLPAGRRIHAGTPAAGYDEGSGIAWLAEQEAVSREWARAHPGVPLLWATDEPVPDVGQVWHELHAMAGETGLVPITLAFLDRRPGHRGRPWDSGELSDPYPLSAADELDAAAVLHGVWDFYFDPDDDPREIEVLRSLPVRRAARRGRLRRCAPPRHPSAPVPAGSRTRRRRDLLHVRRVLAHRAPRHRLPVCLRDRGLHQGRAVLGLVVGLITGG